MCLTQQPKEAKAQEVKGQQKVTLSDRLTVAVVFAFDSTLVVLNKGPSTEPTSRCITAQTALGRMETEREREETAKKDKLTHSLRHLTFRQGLIPRIDH